jgi:hypothetical protein
MAAGIRLDVSPVRKAHDGAVLRLCRLLLHRLPDAGTEESA